MANDAALAAIADDPRLPTPPVVALRVLETASRPDCGINEICQHLNLDPSLSGKILRLVNSPLYGLTYRVSSMRRALMVIGLNAARSLALSLSLPEMLQKVPAVALRRYWESSIAGAIAARDLSVALRRPEPDDDLAAGLLRDLGSVILAQYFPEGYARVWEQPPAALTSRLCELEIEHCGLSHTEISAFILGRWRLPWETAEAIRCHHHPDRAAAAGPAVAARAQVLHFATRVAELLTGNRPQLLDEVRSLARSRFQMDERKLRDYLEPLGGKIAEFCKLINVEPPPREHCDAALARASQELAALAVGGTRDLQVVREEKARSDAEAERWRSEAAFDPLTRAYNRRHLEKTLADWFSRPLPARPFGLLFIDLDGFKQLNDRCGHAAGDHMLRAVAEELRRSVRADDVVARYGGDEFCILAADVAADDLGSLARRVWTAVNAIAPPRGTPPGLVGASVGAVLCRPPRTHATPADLLASADAAMYQAKRAGKNQIVFVTDGADEADPPPVRADARPRPA